MTIVTGFTDTEDARAALRRAVEEAELRGEDLVVLQMRADGGVPEDHAAVLADLLDGVTVRHEVRTPPTHSRDVAGDLVELARLVDASLIVIGLRRRSPVGKLLLGSQAQRIILDATVPVLAVKP